MRENVNTDRVLRRRLILEEYGPDIEYIKYENNIVVYRPSRTPLNKINRLKISPLINRK